MLTVEIWKTLLQVAWVVKEKQYRSYLPFLPRRARYWVKDYFRTSIVTT
jgi:hypothetical protein